MENRAEPAAAIGMQRERDKVIDGLRGLAVTAVIAGHGLAYRFSDPVESGGYFTHQLARLAGPLADGGVLLFFAISGFIITSLLLREEANHGRFSIAAFYARRAFRILPALWLFLCAITVLAESRVIIQPIEDIPKAALFICNFGVTTCGWFVAHTWSLAVEEQFYLVWPLLLAITPSRWRLRVVVGAVICLLALHAVTPRAWHSNYISFACIAAGAACAIAPGWQDKLRRCGTTVTLGLGLGFALAGPLLLPIQLMDAAMPLLSVFLLFGVRDVWVARVILTSAPLQALGALSYGLYLWQQLFLGPPSAYVGEPLAWLLLPVVVLASNFLLERPVIRFGHRISARIALRGIPNERVRCDMGS